MSRTIKYEFLKIFTSKLFLYTLLAFVLADTVILIYTGNIVKKDEIPYSAYKILNEELKDLPESEKEELINKEYERNNAFSIITNIINNKNSESEYIREFAESLKNENKELYDKYINEYENRTYKYTGDEAKELELFEEIKKEYDECKNYKNTITGILEKADDLETISIFQESEDDFSNKNIKDTAKNYEKMLNVEVHYIPSKGIDSFTNMGITDIFIVLMIFVMATIIIYEEREKNLFPLIKSTKNGRCKTILSKIFVMFIAILAISLILYAVNFIYYGITIGYGDLSANLQSINTFIYSTLQISIGGYIALFLITKIAVFFIVSLMILLVSNLAKNNTSNYIALILIFGISFLLYKTIDPISKYNVFRIINIINLIEVNSIYKTYMNLNIMGNMQNILHLSLFFAIILLFIFGFANIWIFTKRKDLGLTENRLLKRLKSITIIKPRIFTKIFWCELYKMMIINKVLIILLLFTVIQIYSLNNANKNISFSENIYKNYMKTFSGKLTEEKENSILKEQEKFEKAKLAIENIEEKVQNGEISKEEAIRYKEPYNEILSSEEIFLRIIEQYEQIKENPKAEFVYDTGYNELLRVNKNAFIESDVYLIVMAEIAFSVIFVMEYKTGMNKILNTTPKGKTATTKAKIIVCLITGLMIFMISIIPEIIKIGQIYGFDNITASITSLRSFSSLPSGISILGFTIICYLVRFIIFISIILFILWISLKLKNTTYTILVASTIMLVPIIVAKLGIEFLNIISVDKILNLSKIILMDSSLKWLYIAIPSVIGIHSYERLLRKDKI